MHSVAKGDLTVAMLTARFLKLSYSVLRPVTELSRYDLVIDRGNGFERVQCKTARTKGGAIIFNTCSSLRHHGNGGGRSSYIGQCELFGVYHPETDNCYLVPVSDVGATQGILRISPPKNGQATGVRLASFYALT